MRLLPTILLLACALSACATAPKGLPGGDTQRALTAHPWQLVAAYQRGGQPINGLIGNGLAYQLRITDAQLALEGGCNRMWAGYAIDGAILKVSPLASTRMGCEPARMEADNWMARQFEMPLKMRFDGPTRLELEMMDGSKLRFEAR